MSTIGSIESYDPAKENWSSYVKRFDQFVIANDLKEEKRIVAVFLTSVGSKVYNFLRDLMAPVKPSDFKLSELKKTLAGHYNPKPIVIVERFHFHKRDQLEGESVADYSAALKKYSERCQFNAFLEEALRDRFVRGLRGKKIQKRLLAEEDLTCKKALETAVAMECAEKHAYQFRFPPAPQASPINALPQIRPAEKKNKPCFRGNTPTANVSI